jgi:hypothetical protein
MNSPSRELNPPSREDFSISREVKPLAREVISSSREVTPIWREVVSIWREDSGTSRPIAPGSRVAGASTTLPALSLREAIAGFRVATRVSIARFISSYITWF